MTYVVASSEEPKEEPKKKAPAKKTTAKKTTTKRAPAKKKAAPKKTGPEHFIVTGTGRNGTFWLSTALNHVLGEGSVSHEIVFNAATDIQKLYWGNYQGECSNGAAAWLGRLDNSYPVLNLVRNPVDAAVSWFKCRGYKRTLLDDPMYRQGIDFRNKYAPGIFASDREVDMAVDHVLLWSELCARWADSGNPYRVARLEDIDGAELKSIINFLTDNDSYSERLCKEAVALPITNPPSHQDPTEYFDDKYAIRQVKKAKNYSQLIDLGRRLGYTM